MDIYITLGISFLSSLFAAFLAHYFATSRMKKNDLSQFQMTAYADFLGAVSRLSVTRRLGNIENNVDDLTILNDSKNRILVSGEPQVVEALINFWQNGSTLEKEQEIIAFDHLLQLIRQSIGHKRNDTSNFEVSNTLFKLEPSTFSYKESKKS